MTTQNTAAEAPDSPRPRWVSRDQAAAAFGVHPMTLDRWIKAGDMPAYKMGGRVFVPSWAVFPEEVLPQPEAAPSATAA
ncbi:helix-turn-helix domain-containing protein [Qipengyuania gaetbuli]|uniref:helix-turn-helix domain-containing protein n=1 Tax=Qipengyuania gaetbuli TaxID=266952 RepID=UPI001CFE3191|nr:helix-turn-helix domain-containing protein [Qipengyuania gaetbuli]